MTYEMAFAECARLTRRHSSTFFLGSNFFRGDRRRAVLAVYAACRLGDDAVDGATDVPTGRRRLEAWSQGVERAFAGRPDPAVAFEVALAWTCERFPLPRAAFDELALGLATDLEPVDMATLEAFMLYCRRVAGVVGWLVAPIAGYRGGDDTLDAAMALGQAMQITNVLRDVGEDLSLGRMYLPRELRERYGVDVELLRQGQVHAGYVALLEDLGGRAHALYRHGWRGVPRLHGSASLAVGVAALNYEAIVHKLRRNGYDNLTRRAYLRPHERLALIPRALAGVTFRSPS
jgi:15-cis-phytoene synthase